MKNLEVSAIGYGCMGLSHGYGPAPPKEEGIRLIQTAYDMGCTFFDTAEGYGAGADEELVGQAVKPFRQQIVLVTKLHLRTRENVVDYMESHLDASLRRLGTDYVDLYYQLGNLTLYGNRTD